VLLAIDSSSVAASCAIFSQELLVAENFQNTGLTHSSTLLPMIESMMKNAGKTPGDISQIIVTNGPGSFTGLRIGISTALGLAKALGIPCLGVSSLMALAYGAAGHQGVIIPVMDARRDQLYTASFSCDDGVISRICPDRAISRHELLAENYDKPICWTGDAAAQCRRDGQHIAARPYSAAYGAAQCAFMGHTRKAEQPEYLRLPQAERERMEKQRV